MLFFTLFYNIGLRFIKKGEYYDNKILLLFTIIGIFVIDNSQIIMQEYKMAAFIVLISIAAGMGSIVVNKVDFQLKNKTIIEK